MLDEKSIEIYTSRDKIREQLISLAKTYLQLENFDFNKSSYLSYIINMLSVLDANLMYYISSVYREQFLSKAVQRESVLNLANIIGYKPLLADPATVTILIEVPYDPTSNDAKVLQLIGRNHTSISTDLTTPEPPIFKVYSTDNIQFSLIDSIIVDISTSGNVKVSQQVYLTSRGSINVGWKTLEHRFVNGNIQFLANFIQLVEITETFTIPELLPNEFHNIPYNFNKIGSIADIDVFTVSTTTNGVLERWTRKESIFGIGPDEAAFTYRETEKGITLSFGNGVIGRQPKRGTNVIVTVGLTQGFKGNVIAGTIKKSDAARMLIKTSPQEVYKYVQLKVINKEPSQFGNDAPTIDEVRNNAINRVSTNSRLVSQRDFENADLVVENLPIRNVAQVLKRSDLKRNEITLFTELIYNNIVVPTRNAYIDISKTDVGDSDNYQIKAELTEITIDDESYITLFDLFLDQYTKELNYYYFISETQKPVTITQTITGSEPTKILPIYSYYSTDRTSEPEELIVELHCNVIDTTSNYECKMIVDWPNINGESTYILHDTTSKLSSDISSVKIFSTQPDADQTSDFSIQLSTVPEGSLIEFNYIISLVEGNTKTELNRCKNSVIIKRELNDFMYSQVEVRTDVFRLYDVPVIKKDYYENLINKNLFTSSVLQKIIEFNIFEYKMVTDFVNLKFANTTGYSSNMKYRSITKQSVIDINPTSIPLSSDSSEGDRYAITDDKNPWAVSTDFPDITGGGYIVYYTNSLDNKWGTESLKVNDIIDVTNLNGSQNTVRMIYNGDDLVEPKFKIPIDIKLAITPSGGLTLTDQVLVKLVKDTLVLKLAPYFGYNKNLLRSVIIKTVQDIPGIEHVELITPTFNIKFEPDPYKNMTQEELLRYTPELIFFSTENIIVEVRD